MKCFGCQKVFFIYDNYIYPFTLTLSIDLFIYFLINFIEEGLVK